MLACSYPCAYFFTNGIKAVELGPTVMDGIHALGGVDLTVLYSVNDGAPENRSWMGMAADPELAAQIAARKSSACLTVVARVA